MALCVERGDGRLDSSSIIDEEEKERGSRVLGRKPGREMETICSSQDFRTRLGRDFEMAFGQKKVGIALRKVCGNWQ